MDDKENPPFIPRQSIGFIINDVARLIRRNFNRRVQHLGLTQAQWQVLAHLSRNEGMRQIQLADALEMQPISVARIIDRMESSGWVARKPDPADRRAFNLFVTSKATPILEQMRELGAETRSQALAGIPEPLQEQILQALLQMRENLANDVE